MARKGSFYNGEGVRAARALFEGERLTLARLYNGLNKSDLAEKIGVTPAAIGQYERGHARPSPDVILKLSGELRFPPAFFEHGRTCFQIKHEEAHFRRLRATTKLERSRVLARAELLMELVEELERYLNLPKFDPPHLSLGRGAAQEIENAAESLRKQWDLGLGPVSNVVRLLERQGVVVTRLPKGETSERVDAFCTWMGARPVVVLTSEKDSVTRWRFDASHELGHLVLHQDAEPGSQEVEKQAHRFAAAFLMPQKGIIDWLPRRVFWPEFIDLKKKWKVSISALLRRCRDLGTISEDQYRRGMIQYNANGWRSGEPWDRELKDEALANKIEQPLLVHKAASMLAQCRNITEVDLANNLRITIGRLADLVPSPAPEKLDVEL